MSISSVSRFSPSDHGRRRQAIVESLLSEIFQGAIEAGQHLVTQDVADRFGVSHTPVREAMAALAGIGIIDLVPNRGAIVRRVSHREIREICQVRRALECEAVSSACGRLDEAFLTELADDFRRLAAAQDSSAAEVLDQAKTLDSRLHDSIAAGCGNAFLAAELGRLKLLFRAFRDVAYIQYRIDNDLPRIIEEAGQHLAIVEALAAGKRRTAMRAMSVHIRSGLKYWLRARPDTINHPTV
ncbi:MAG TPA: GntR family transcriptional regulator [Pirellulales bacterium]|nr:GntR family transcriptional regulator [Pirellulales bacterium]